MAKESKYNALAIYLYNTNVDTVTLTFKEIEDILGFKLSLSARKYRANWSNNSGQAISTGWLSAGYETYLVDMENEVVNFKKNNGTESDQLIGKSTKKRASRKHKTNGIVITGELIEEGHRMVLDTDDYGRENNLITECFTRFPDNTDVVIVAMKIGLIDITNSTHVSQHKSKINAVELAEGIVRIKNIDERIKKGDPEVVREIAKCKEGINLFSFATKYCCYHNTNLYKRDDYSILDTVLKESLPKYFDDITTSQIQKWQDAGNYKEYNDYITKKLDELNITNEFRKRKFDHYIWFNNRKK